MILAETTSPLRRLMGRLIVRTLPHLPVPIAGAIYRRWIGAYEHIPSELRQAMAASINTWPRRVPISMLLRCDDTDPKRLEQTLTSLKTQIYPHWELCVSDDAHLSKAARRFLEHVSQSDPRIRVKFADRAIGASAKAEAALALAGGDYFALLDAGDELSEDALYWVARELTIFPETDLLFTDEDKIDRAGRRHEPYFKSAWNPALMLSRDAFSRLGIVRRKLAVEIGGFRRECEGAEDYDLVLRCSEHTSPDRIRHIPRVLYHRRDPKPAVTSAPVLSGNWEAGKLAIIGHLERSGIAATVKPAATKFYQVEYRAPQPSPFVSLIVPSGLKSQTTAACLRSILTKTAYQNFEMLLLTTPRHQHEAQRNPAFADILQDHRVRIITYEKHPFNFSWVSNFGARSTSARYICMLNDDVEAISSDWLDQLVCRTALDGIGATGPMMYYPSDRIQHAGVLLGVGGVADHAFRLRRRGYHESTGRGALEQDYSCVTAACMLIRSEIFAAVGGFDETLPVAYNDVDLCIRIRRLGARIVWTPSAEMYHHESASFGSHTLPARREQFRSDFAKMRERWNDVLDADPDYNPNLSLVSGLAFSLAWPPRAPKPAEIISATGEASFSRTAQLAMNKATSKTKHRG